MEETINAAAKDQGVNASVSVKYDAAAGTFAIQSNNKDVDSEFSYIGNDGSTAANAAKGVMTTLLGDGTDAGAGTGAASINTATMTYEGKAITADAAGSFNMTINGVKVNAQPGTLATGATMTETAASVQTAVQDAVANYNTTMGLTEGAYDTKSGLTGLTVADFTAAVGDNGNIKVTYAGDEDVSFSFSDHLSPVLVQNTKDSSYTHIIMPLNS